MGKYFASFMLLLGALLPIWIGAHRSLGRNDEVDENGKKKEAPKVRLRAPTQRAALFLR